MATQEWLFVRFPEAYTPLFKGELPEQEEGKGKGEFSVRISIFRLLFWKQNYLTLDLLKGVLCLKYCLGVCVQFWNRKHLKKFKLFCVTWDHVFLWICLFFLQILKKTLMSDAALWEKNKGRGNITILNCKIRRDKKRDEKNSICNRSAFLFLFLGCVFFLVAMIIFPLRKEAGKFQSIKASGLCFLQISWLYYS